MTGTMAQIADRLCRILRDAVAERPVFLLDLDQTDKNILATQAGIVGEAIGDRGVQRLLLLDAAGVIAGDLNEGQVVGIDDAEILRRAYDFRTRPAFAENLKVVVDGNVEGSQHRLVDSQGYRGAKGGRLSCGMINADEGHDESPLLMTQRIRIDPS